MLILRYNVLVKSNDVQSLSNDLLYCHRPERRKTLYEAMKQTMQEYFRDVLRSVTPGFRHDHANASFMQVCSSTTYQTGLPDGDRRRNSGASVLWTICVGCLALALLENRTWCVRRGLLGSHFVTISVRSWHRPHGSNVGWRLTSVVHAKWPDWISLITRHFCFRRSPQNPGGALIFFFRLDAFDLRQAPE